MSPSDTSAVTVDIQPLRTRRPLPGMRKIRGGRGREGSGRWNELQLAVCSPRS